MARNELGGIPSLEKAEMTDKGIHTMDNTRENVIALLQELADTALAVSKVFHTQGNEKMEDCLWGEYHAYTNAIGLLSDNTYFNEIREIEDREGKE